MLPAQGDSHSHAPHPAGGQERIRPHGTFLPHSDSHTRIAEAMATGSAGLLTRVIQGLSLCACVLGMLAFLLRGCELVLSARLQSGRGGRCGLSSHPSLFSLRRVKVWARAAADSPYSTLSRAGCAAGIATREAGRGNALEQRGPGTSLPGTKSGSAMRRKRACVGQPLGRSLLLPAQCPLSVAAGATRLLPWPLPLRGSPCGPPHLPIPLPLITCHPQESS